MSEKEQGLSWSYENINSWETLKERVDEYFPWHDFSSEEIGFFWDLIMKARLGEISTATMEKSMSQWTEAYVQLQKLVQAQEDQIRILSEQLKLFMNHWREQYEEWMNLVQQLKENNSRLEKKLQMKNRQLAASQSIHTTLWDQPVNLN